jgi:hypothetical protein
VENERIFAFAGPFTFHEIFSIIKKKFPDHKLPEDLSGDDKDLSEVATMARSVELLKRRGRDGYTPLEQSVLDAISTITDSTAGSSVLKSHSN